MYVCMCVYIYIYIYMNTHTDPPRRPPERQPVAANADAKIT